MENEDYNKVIDEVIEELRYDSVSPWINRRIKGMKKPIKKWYVRVDCPNEQRAIDVKDLLLANIDLWGCEIRVEETTE